jgi:hypothetical protein
MNTTGVSVFDDHFRNIPERQVKTSKREYAKDQRLKTISKIKHKSARFIEISHR